MFVFVIVFRRRSHSRTISGKKELQNVHKFVFVIVFGRRSRSQTFSGKKELQNIRKYPSLAVRRSRSRTNLSISSYNKTSKYNRISYSATLSDNRTLALLTIGFKRLNYFYHRSFYCFCTTSSKTSYLALLTPLIVNRSMVRSPYYIQIFYLITTLPRCMNYLVFNYSLVKYYDRTLTCLEIVKALFISGIERNPGPDINNLEIITINCNDLTSDMRLLQVVGKIKKQIKSNQAIVLLQETHNTNIVLLENIWNGPINISMGTGGSRGVITLCTLETETIAFKADTEGRYLFTTTKIGDKNLLIQQIFTHRTIMSYPKHSFVTL